jgi:molybdopterin-guanine dinucleotide biosynthesis protein A
MNLSCEEAQMDAIVTAGGIPMPEDPLYAYSNGNSKAMLDVAGKPMIQWVLDALSDANNVDQVVIVGMSPKSGVTCKKPMTFLSNQGRMLANIVAGVDKVLELDPDTEYVLMVSSDIPGITPEMVDWLIDTAMDTNDDIYYGIVPREVMETRYPNSNRTYTRLKDMEVCGADMNITHVSMTTEQPQESAQAGCHDRFRHTRTIIDGSFDPGRDSQARDEAPQHHRSRNCLGTCRTRDGCG